MALEQQTIKAWQGEDFDIPLGPFTDSDSASISLTSATITLVVTSEKGSGTTHISKTVGSGIIIDGGGTFATASIDGSADTDSLDAGLYWWECKAVLSGGDELQLVAPSHFELRLSAI